MTSVSFLIFSNNNRDRLLRPSVTNRPPVSSRKTFVPRPAIRSPRSVDDPHFANVIANTVNFAHKAHVLGNVITKPPEIDDVATRSQRGRVFNQNSVGILLLSAKRQALGRQFLRLKSGLMEHS